MLNSCLVVDDHEMIRESLALMIKALGVQNVYTAIDGADAISKIYHHHPSLIITDLQMEPIDGLEMLRLIRSGRYNLHYNIPIIILTANAAESIIFECITYDVDAFLVKPVNRQSLQDRIEQLAKEIKNKKSVEHYYDLYQQDPTKSTTFTNNGEIAFTDLDDKEFETLLLNQNEDVVDVPTITLDENTLEDIKEKHFAYIKWQDRFSVGHDDLDSSNQKLLNIINDTYTLIKENPNNKNEFEKLAIRFQKYYQEHLVHEERILFKYGYIRLKSHKTLHSQLIKQAEFILLKCQADPSYYPIDFFKLLRIWWIKHIINEDMKYKSIFER